MRPTLAIAALLGLLAVAITWWSIRPAVMPIAPTSTAPVSDAGVAPAAAVDVGLREPAVGGREPDAATQHALRVRTIDPEGRVVPGTIVRLTLHFADGGSALLVLPPSDTAGIATCPPVDTPPELVRADLVALLVGSEGPRVAVDLRALRDEPVDVLVPAWGSVEAVLLGPDGDAWAFADDSATHVTLRRADAESPQKMAGIDGVSLGRDGRARVAPVACGHQWNVATTGAWEVTCRAQGPQQPGEHVRVELRIPADTRILAGRVVEATGGRAQGKVQARMEGPRGQSSMAVDLTAAGRFRLQMQAHLGDRPKIAFLRRREEAAIEDAAEVILAAPLVAGVNEVGDVVLRPAPLLLAGRVLAAEGVDLARVVLEVQRTREGAPDAWDQDWHTKVHRKPDGRFEAYALAQGSAYRLAVRGECAPVPPLPFAPGMVDLGVRVTAGGSVTATLLGDASLDALEYWLVPDAGPGRARAPRRGFDEPGREARPRRTDAGAQVEWRALAPGSHRLLVRCPGFEPLVDVRVLVPANGTVDDPRLRDIDLRAAIRSIRIRVTDQADAPLAVPAQVLMRDPPGEGAEWRGAEVAPGWTATLVVPRPVDLVVVAAGRRGVVVPGVFADTTVTLAPAPRVHAVFADAPALPAGVTASLRWSLAGVAAAPRFELQQRSGARRGDLAELIPELAEADWSVGRVTIPAACPLPLRAEVILRARAQRSLAVRLRPTVIDLTGLADDETLMLSCEQDPLRAALDALRRR